MTQTLKSTRFGDVEISDDALVEFPNGLIGLRGTRYALVPHDATGEANHLVVLWQTQARAQLPPCADVA